jgi:hypothetical protein
MLASRGHASLPTPSQELTSRGNTPPPIANNLQGTSRVPDRKFYVQRENGREQHLSPTSLVSLIYEMKESILTPLCDTEACLVNPRGPEAACGRLSLLADEEDQVEFSQDGSMPINPPLPILQAMVGPYFSTINEYFPIWTREEFCSLMDNNYNPVHQEPDPVFAICANNLILLTLNAMTLHCRAKNVSNVFPHWNSLVDKSLTSHFLNNAKRAIAHLGPLLTPRLINLQAILSLVSRYSKVKTRDINSGKVFSSTGILFSNHLWVLL